MISKFVSNKSNKNAIISLALLILGTLAFRALPPNTVNPFCTYRAQYRLDATLQVGDERISSFAIRQSSQSRRWISVMNSSGCNSFYGGAIAFKSKDNRVFLIPTDVCEKAEKSLNENVDVIKTCSTSWPNRSIGFIIDNGENPTNWQIFNFLSGDKNARLTSMNAKSTWRHPHDEIEKIAPNVLKAYFDFGNDWWYSPERILSFERRSGSMSFRVQKIGPSPSRD